ncbi:MAG: TetR/AcrR family transcriptional regulator [Elusimicrobia bacterium]|nr:TetR/AcrR family transcriptional regulator [Elusimicrobiota bacterium]
MTPTAPTDESTSETRRRIVEAAHERFRAAGYSPVTMDDIAHDLGMSKKTLYEFFPAKLELLRATRKMRSAACQREMEAIAAEKLDFFARARKTFGYISQIYSSLTPAYMTDIRRSAPEVWNEIQEFKRTTVRRNMLELIDHGIAHGFLRKDLDRETLVQLYLTMTTALLNPELSGWSSGEPIAAAFDVFVRIYFEGLITDSGRRRLKGREGVR